MVAASCWLTTIRRPMGKENSESVLVHRGHGSPPRSFRCGGGERLLPDTKRLTVVPASFVGSNRDPARSTFTAHVTSLRAESSTGVRGRPARLWQPLARRFVSRRHLALLAVRRLSLFPASDPPIRERRERDGHDRPSRARAPSGSSLHERYPTRSSGSFANTPAAGRPRRVPRSART